MNAPWSVSEEAKLKVQDGAKSTRNKGLKHFNKVGYMGHELKEVPRWACSDEAILKVVEYQKKRGPEYLQVFGFLKPKYVQQTFKLQTVFRKGTNFESYFDVLDLDERGSSANWNDDGEFDTPIPNCLVNISLPDGQSLSEGKIAHSE